jgi:hypothetical protein
MLVRLRRLRRRCDDALDDISALGQQPGFGHPPINLPAEFRTHRLQAERRPMPCYTVTGMGYSRDNCLPTAACLSGADLHIVCHWVQVHVTSVSD